MCKSMELTVEDLADAVHCIRAAVAESDDYGHHEQAAHYRAVAKRLELLINHKGAEQ